MYRCRKAAEDAAADGKNQDMDTQQCRDLQEEILSSSPIPIPRGKPRKFASNSFAADERRVVPFEYEFEPLKHLSQSQVEPEPEPEPEADELPSITETEKPEGDADELAGVERRNSEPAGLDNSIDAEVEREPKINLAPEPALYIQQPVNCDPAPIPRKSLPRVRIRRNSRGQLRPFSALDGSQLQSIAGRAMEGCTQRSSLSATQENSASVFERFAHTKLNGEYQPTPSDVDDDDDGDDLPTIALAHDSTESRKYASARTEDSTAHTFEENDTGHVNLMFPPGSGEEDLDDFEESQDTSHPGGCSIYQEEPMHAPETPVLPINPFAHRGTVMKGHELFGATQPTPTGRLISEASSRPSPNIFDDYSSPVKAQRLGVTPLKHITHQDTSPLQKNVRNMLGRCRASSEEIHTHSPRGVHSVDDVGEIQRADSDSIIAEPRPYKSMKESQERRRDSAENSATESNSDDDMKTHRKKRIQQREINSELANVSLSRRSPVSSSRPGSANHAAIEIPSTGRTGRRRSVEESYIARCEGRNARDTQQTSQMQTQTPFEDAGFVADSQDLPTHDSPRKDFVEEPTEPNTPVSLPAAAHEEAAAAVRAETAASPVPVMGPRAKPHVELPLQEMSTNAKLLRTPSVKNALLLSSAAEEAIPETSPLSTPYMPRLHKDIAREESFEQSEDPLAHFKGFSQDVAYDNAMGIQRSPSPARVTPAQLPRSIAPLPNEPTTSAEEQLSANKTALILGGLATMVSQVPNYMLLEPAIPSNSESRSEGNAPTKLAVHSDFIVPSEPEISSDQEMQPEPGDIRDARAPTTTELHAEQGLLPREAEPDTTAVDTMDKLMVDPEVTGEHVNGPKNADDAPELVQEAVISTKKQPVKQTYGKKGRGKSLRGQAGRSTPRSSARLSTPKVAAEPGKKARSGRTATPTASSSATPRSTPNKFGKEKASDFKKSARSTRQSMPAPLVTQPDSGSLPAKRTAARNSGPIVAPEVVTPTTMGRPTRQAPSRAAKEDSIDPLALTAAPDALFAGMTFAVSYIKNDREKEKALKLIADNGGTVLQDGFDSLFQSPIQAQDNVVMELSDLAKTVTFSALIANEHSRTKKYMQALALGLPSISGRWVERCVLKNEIVDWRPYLLSAGQSVYLGNAVKSRNLRPYAASEAKLHETLAARDMLLEGKSVLLVAGKGKDIAEKRRTFLFLARSLGPERVGQATDFNDARKKLLDAENRGEDWDLVLHLDSNEKAADSAIFGSSAPPNAPKKRKRGEANGSTPPPKRTRTINDETMIQTLIFGQLVDD